MNVSFREVSSNPRHNVATLAEGVKGVVCTSAVSMVDTINSNMLSTEQLNCVQKAEEILARVPGAYIGTIELYENAAMNLYIKDRGKVIGYVLVRP